MMKLICCLEYPVEGASTGDVSSSLGENCDNLRWGLVTELRLATDLHDLLPLFFGERPRIDFSSSFAAVLGIFSPAPIRARVYPDRIARG